MFGAHYPDAQCIDGYLWDLDSYDDGLLTSGGDIPCPSCQTALCLSNAAACAKDDLPQPHSKQTPASTWEIAVISALEVNGPAARQYLSSLTPFELLDRKDRIDGPSRPWEDAEEESDKDIVWRMWPWPVAGMSKHDQIAIHPHPKK